MENTNQKLFVLDGYSLSPDDLYEMSKGNCKIELSEQSWKRVKLARGVIDDIIQRKEVVYGVNTGFGNFANTIISPENLVKLQKNLIRSHCAGVGSPLTLGQTRMLLALRINVLAKGFSGISEDTLKRYIAGFNNDVLPYIPEKGTVGASGDLAPLSHLALGLMGEGKAWDFEQSKYVQSSLILKKKGLEPIELKEKEGLALINGTQFMTCIGVESLIRAEIVAKTADYVSGLTFEAQFGNLDSLDQRVHFLKGHQGQKEVAQRILRVVTEKDGTSSSMNNQLTEQYSNFTPNINQQDGYSILCIPQVHGITHDTLKFVRKLLTEELNSATDNPLVFLKEDHASFDKDCMLSGGNFHGEYSSKALDYLTIAISEIGSISERRIERLVNPQLSHLQDFLIENGGLNNGFMIAHCTAAALVSENKTYSHPASVDTITTSANQEDHVSMGGWAARKSLLAVKNVEYIISIELMAVCQALDLLQPRQSTSTVRKVHQFLRQKIPYLKEDQVFTEYFEEIAMMIQNKEIINIVEN